MNRYRWLGLGTLFLVAAFVQAQAPFTNVAADVNKKMCKVFGAGGFKGLPSYGTGVVVSPKGHILTVNNHILQSQNLRVHMYDGRYYNVRVLFREPELDAAVLQVEEDVDFLPHFDLDKEAARPLAETGDWVLAFSNCFQIATRDEPMSVMRGVIAARAELRGRRGVFEPPYNGEVYFLDCIASNPGAAGGVLADRKGHLLGIVGRELKNTLTDTWINYAVPIQATADIMRKEKTVKVTMAEFVKESIKGTYKQSEGRAKREDKGGYHGLILVYNAVGNTPAYVEEVLPGSPAAEAGLRPDDLILYVDGELVASVSVFRDIVRGVGPGSELKIEAQRGNRLQSFKLKLTEQPKAKAVK